MGARNKDGVRKEKRDGKNRWIIDIRWLDKNGVEHRYRRDAKVQTAEAAHAEAREIRMRIFMQGTLERRDPLPTFRKFVDDTYRPNVLEGGRLKPKTAQRYETSLRQGVLDHYGEKRLDTITEADHAAFDKALKTKGIKPGNPLICLRAVLHSANDLLRLDPPVPLPTLAPIPYKIPRAPDADEGPLLLAHATGALHRALAVAYHTGQRINEARATTVSDVDLSRNAIAVRRSLSGKLVTMTKNMGERPIPIARGLRPILEAACKDRPPEARIVAEPDGHVPSYNGLLKQLHRLQRTLGLPERGFHAFRHGFCTTLAQSGIPVETIRALAGHASITTTSRYVHATRDDLKAAVEILATTPRLLKLPQHASGAANDSTPESANTPV